MEIASLLKNGVKKAKTMKKIYTAIILLIIVVGISACAQDDSSGPEIQTDSEESTEETTVSGETGLTLAKTIEVTPDDTYKYGAFCRVNYVGATDNFFVSFGGSSPIVGESDEQGGRAGGAEGGDGYSYKVYSKEFEYTGEDGIISNSGGDAATVMAEEYFYILKGAPGGWKIDKIDPQTWEVVDSTTIEMDEKYEATNDQMLAYANGYLIASSLYNAEGESDQTKTDPNKGYGTHNRIFTTDLEQVDYFILDDIEHINGAYVIFKDTIYNYITSTAYFGELIIMQYDQNWKYLDTKTTGINGHWSQGAVYDSTTKKFYVAYINLGELNNGKLDLNHPPQINVGIFDEEWNLLGNEIVTAYKKTENTAVGRPSVIIEDGTLYVSYDVETFDSSTNTENKDWQCIVAIYTIA